MAAESINEVVSPEAISNIKNLYEQLGNLKDMMADLIVSTANYNTELGKATGYKNVSDSLNNLNKETEKLHQKNVEYITVEREFKKESENMANAIMKEKELWDKVGVALNKITITEEKTLKVMASSIVELKKQEAAQKDSIKAIIEAEKKLKEKNITQIEFNKIQTENNSKIAESISEQHELKATIAEAKISLKAFGKEGIEASGSMDQMSSRLGLLRDEYRGLSDEERNTPEIGGVMKAGINQLDEALKTLDASIGNYQRNVGGYAVASKTMLTEIRNMKNELLEANININFFNDEIKKQKQVLLDTAKTHGEASNEYKEAENKLDALISKQEKYVTVSTDLKTAIKDLTNEQKLSNSEMELMTDPALTFKTLTGAVNMATQAYTAYKGILSFVGSENKELEETMQKLMGLMMVANSIQRLSNDLLSRNGTIMKVKVMWEKISIAYNRQLAIEQAKKAAATKIVTVAMTEETSAMVKGTVATAAQGTAATVSTAANFSLAAAIKMVGNAIKSIPVVGWILAAAAFLGTVGTVLFKTLTAEKELTEEQKRRKQVIEDLNKIQTEVAKSTQETVTKLRLYTSELDKVKKGSNEWKAIVGEIAKTTGEDYNELVKFPDKIKDITDEWINQYQARAKMEATFKQVTANYEKIVDIQSISEKDRKKILKDLGFQNEELDDMLQSYKDIEDYNDRASQYAPQARRMYDGKALDASERVALSEEKIKKNVEETNKKLLEKVDILGLITEQSTKKPNEKTDDSETKRQEYLLSIFLKYEELKADTEKKMLDLHIKRLEEQRDKEIALYGKTEDDKKLIMDRYNIEIQKTEEDYNKKLLEKQTQAINEMLSITNKLNEERIKNGTVSNEEMTRLLVENTKKRYEAEIKHLEVAKEKELEVFGKFAKLEEDILVLQRKKEEDILTEAEQKQLGLLETQKATYLAVSEKWNAKLSESEQKQADEIVKIKKEGFDKQLALLNQQAKDAENKAIIDGNGAITAQQASELKINAIKNEIKAWESKEKKIKELAITEEEYNSKMLELERAKSEETKKMLDEEFQMRISNMQQVIDSVFALGDALAGNIEDEKEQAEVRAKLGLMQVLLNGGIALAAATRNALEYPGPAAIAALIANVATVTANIINATAQIRKAQSAYAEGTDYHRGGSALIGEKIVNGKYQPEVVQTPDKKLFMVDQPSYFDKLPIGTSVTPLPEFDYNSKEYGEGWDNNGYGELAQKFERNNILLEQLLNKPTATINVSDKITSYIETKMSKTKMLNAMFKF